MCAYVLLCAFVYVCVFLSSVSELVRASVSFVVYTSVPQLRKLQRVAVCCSVLQSFVVCASVFCFVYASVSQLRMYVLRRTRVYVSASELRLPSYMRLRFQSYVRQCLRFKRASLVVCASASQLRMCVFGRVCVCV